MLIRCSECGEQISDQAGACPHCGAPVEHGAQRVADGATLAYPRRSREIVLFSSLVIVLLGLVFYIVGRLVLVSKLRNSFDAYDVLTYDYAAEWARFHAVAFLERDLVVYAGAVLFVVIGVLLSWVVWRALHLDRARRSTRWISGCSVSLGIVATLVAGWIFWANSYLPLVSSFFPEFPASWKGWFPLHDSIPSYVPEQWWLIPALSSVFLVCTLIAVAVRAVYVRLFERH